MTDEPGTSPELPFEALIARTQALEPDFLGLSRAEAELLAVQHELELRVIDSDGAAVTADLRSNRMTVDVRTGVVSEARAG